jgi:hypothetical protein
MPTTKRRVNTRQKRMICNCGQKKIVRFVGGGKKAASAKTKADAARLAKMPGAKKVPAKKIAAKKTKGSPCKCNNPFAKGQ